MGDPAEAIDVPSTIAPMPLPPPQPPEPEEDPKKKKVTKQKAKLALQRLNQDMEVEDLEALRTIGDFATNLGLFQVGTAHLMSGLNSMTRLERWAIGLVKGDAIDPETLEKLPEAQTVTVDQQLRACEILANLAKAKADSGVLLMKNGTPPNPQVNKPSGPYQPFAANAVVVQNFNAAAEPKPVK